MNQLSIFAENRKGTMQAITDILAEEDINILGSVTNDSAEYGIIRMVVSDALKAEDALRKRGYMCRLTEVLGVELDDEVGNLNRLLKVFNDTNVNVNYIYLSYNRNSGKPILIIHTEDIFEVKDCLRARNYTVF